MTQYSHSRVSKFVQCPYRYKLHYIDKYRTLPDDKPDNALYLGTAIHEGIEKGVEAGIQAYYNSFPVINNEHINEAIKLEYLIPIAKSKLPEGEFETKIDITGFVGYIDLLVENEDGTYDLYDFKYSNNIDYYEESQQLHLYKYYFEQQTGKKIRNLIYLFIHKVKIKQKKTEDLYQYRQRLLEELQQTGTTGLRVEYDPNKVAEFIETITEITKTKEFKKKPSYLCRWCEFQKYCEEGVDYMLLPQSERRDITKPRKRKVWLYGAPFSGKTTMLDSAPKPLNLNTDGNIEFVTMPYIAIRDQITVEGRQTKRKFAWEVFKDVISELEKKQNDFQTVIIDLVEDTREMCRVYKYDDLGIQHESDSGYGKGWDIIKTEYLSTIRRFFNLDYENLVILSHEDISKDITKKSGQNITRVAPNIQEALANKIAGMVDIVARVIVEDDGTRSLNFKSSEVIFGGGRLKGVTEREIPLTWEALMEVFDNAAGKDVKNFVQEVQQTEKEEKETETKEEKPTRKARKPRGKKAAEPEVVEPEVVEETEEVEEEQPKRRRRRKK